MRQREALGYAYDPLAGLYGKLVGFSQLARHRCHVHTTPPFAQPSSAAPPGCEGYLLALMFMIASQCSSVTSECRRGADRYQRCSPECDAANSARAVRPSPRSARESHPSPPQPRDGKPPQFQAAVLSASPIQLAHDVSAPMRANSSACPADTTARRRDYGECPAVPSDAPSLGCFSEPVPLPRQGYGGMVQRTPLSHIAGIA